MKRKAEKTGYDLSEEISRLQSTAETMTSQTVCEFTQIVNFIYSLDSSEIWLILSLKYIDNLSWRMISQELGENGTGASERSKVYRFFRQCNQEDSG